MFYMLKRAVVGILELEKRRIGEGNSHVPILKKSPGYTSSLAIPVWSEE